MEKFIQELGKKAGTLAMRYFRKTGVLYSKSGHVQDTVTKADLAVEKMITLAIKKRYPSHGIVGEENGKHQHDAEYQWIIDPIDGTANFAADIPLFGVMIALAHRGKLLLSVVNLPALGELFFAKKGKGAYVNGKRIHCSRIGQWEKTIGCIQSSMHDKKLKKIVFAAADPKMAIVSYGTAAVTFCYVAAGRKDWSISRGAALWDYAAPALVMQEAGCILVNFKGRPWSFSDRELIVGNKKMASTLLRVVKKIK